MTNFDSPTRSEQGSDVAPDADVTVTLTLVISDVIADVVVSDAVEAPVLHSDRRGGSEQAPTSTPACSRSHDQDGLEDSIADATIPREAVVEVLTDVLRQAIPYLDPGSFLQGLAKRAVRLGESEVDR